MRSLVNWLKSLFICDELQHQIVETDPEGWGRYTVGKYLRENCCTHYAGLQETCPFHPRENKSQNPIDVPQKLT